MKLNRKFSELFCEYLKDITTEGNSYYIDKNIEKVLKEATHIISFNYTNTLEQYNINKERVFHIHGNLETSDNLPIIGFYNTPQDIVDSTSFFKRPMSKEILYFRSTGKSLLKRINEYFSSIKDISEVTLIGFSAGGSDRWVCDEILNHCTQYNFNSYKDGYILKEKVEKLTRTKIKVFDYNNSAEETFNNFIGERLKRLTGIDYGFEDPLIYNYEFNKLNYGNLIREEKANPSKPLEEKTS